MKYIIILLLCILIGNNDIPAQEKIHSFETLPRNYLIKVKQLSEFVDRLNYQKDFLDQDIGPEFKSIITRYDYIRLLFDNEDKRFDPDIEDDTYKILIDMFIHEVCSDSVYVDRYSEQIYAELTCQISINGKNEEISILLKREVDNGLKWSIVSVDQNFNGRTEYQQSKHHDLSANDSSEIYIPPLSNETNFIDLKKLLNDQKNLNKLSSKDCVEENVLIFYDMIRSGVLKYQNVKSIVYHILDIPGWVVVVSNFHRNTNNSGWLISDLQLKDDVSSYFIEKFAYSVPGIF